MKQIYLMVIYAVIAVIVVVIAIGAYQSTMNKVTIAQIECKAADESKYLSEQLEHLKSCRDALLYKP